MSAVTKPKRDTFLTISVSREEKDSIYKEASRLDTTVSRFVREKVFGHRPARSARAEG